MIYNSTITTVNESDIMELLENAEDRFENYTMMEASAIIVGEQEENWSRFMKGIGLSELATVMEGEQVIYEGARLEKFFNKAKGFFQTILSKLAEITKSFIAKVDQLFRSNDAFLKKYKAKLLKITVPSDFEFEGYKFQNMGVPEYREPKNSTDITGKVNSIMNSERLTEDGAAEELLPGTDKDASTLDRVTEYFYGDKSKDSLTISVKDQIEILSTTKKDKADAKKSYEKAAKLIKTFIKKLEKAESNAAKPKKNEDGSIEDSAKIVEAYGKLITYWKAYGSVASMKHHGYMRAMGARNRQAKAICVKLLNTSYKEKGKADREKIKARTEGFVTTDAFLGAVEYI